MKWLTPILPYLAVAIGLFWIQNAWAALVGFHLAIILSLLLARVNLPLKVLFTSKDIRWVAFSILLCSSSGISLYFFWQDFGAASDLSTKIQALGLNSSNWIPFLVYFTLVNPFVEEYFWRGYLGSPTRAFYVSDFVYAGFHAFIVMGKVPISSIFYSLAVLTLAGWFWRQIARIDQGLLAPILGHMVADFTILMAVYWRVQ
jgi:membrane protease YdiL (CAAX protease family)